MSSLCVTELSIRLTSHYQVSQEQDVVSRCRESSSSQHARRPTPSPRNTYGQHPDRGSRVGSDDCRTTPANGWIVTTREAALLRSGECRTTFNTYIVGFGDAAHETQIPAASRTSYPPVSPPASGYPTDDPADEWITMGLATPWIHHRSR